jgi:chromosomal replication initiation ATPase DnaA
MTHPLTPIMREAARTGRAIIHVCREHRLAQDTVREVYDLYGHEPLPPYVPDGYMGAQEMARFLAPVYRVSPRMILGDTRFRRAVLARYAIARVMRDRGVSLNKIARSLGRKHHTTVIHMLERYEQEPEAQAGYRLLKGAQVIQ